MKLICDICGGELQMDAINTSATCVNCGINYSIESLRNKLKTNPDVQPTVEVSVDNDIPFSEATPVEDDLHSQTISGETKKNSSQADTSIRKLVVERKFSLGGGAYIANITVDGEDKGSIPYDTPLVVNLSPGEHEVSAVVSNGKKQVNIVGPTRISVDKHNWSGLFYLKRLAFGATWNLDLTEDFKDLTSSL